MSIFSLQAVSQGVLQSVAFFFLSLLKPILWAEMWSSQSCDLLFVSCVVAERSPPSKQQTQHRALVDRNFFRKFFFLCVCVRF